MSASPTPLTRAFSIAYRDPSLAVLEGFHPSRHAMAFGHALELAVTYDLDRLMRLIEQLAPESLEAVLSVIEVVSPGRFATLCPRALSSPLLAIARRPDWDVTAAWRGPDKPLVYLDQPRNPGNVGAVIRAAAAADAAAIVVSGEVDPWSPVVIRSAAGLQFAIPVGRGDLPERPPRPVVALDVGGEPIGTAPLTPRSILVVGGERRGVSPEIRASADRVVGLPMRPGVSSLNLATAVAATLYAWRAAAVVRTGHPPW